MRKVFTWNEYFMDMAKHVAKKSKDPNTQVGCVLVDADNNPISMGFNGFAPGALESQILWERPTKYVRVIHAETNAVGRAAKRGVSTDGATAFVTAFPCLSCAKLLIAAGIKYVVADKLLNGWDDEHKEALARFEEAGVSFDIIQEVEWVH